MSFFSMFSFGSYRMRKEAKISYAIKCESRKRFINLHELPKHQEMKETTTLKMTKKEARWKAARN